MATDRRIQLTPGPAQWAEARWNPGTAELTAYIRFALVGGKRWRAAELRILDPTPEALRSFPLIRIEHAANADVVFVLALAMQRFEEQPGDVRAWFRRSRRRQARQLEQRFKLERPSSRRLPDEFYGNVALAYKDAVAFSLNPRKTLAQDAGTPADTVARWITEARRRGHLPPAAPGKVSA